MDLDEVLAATFTLVAPHLTERQRRPLFGAAARALGYPEATRLLVTADADGTNGYRVRAWKTELASGTGLSIGCSARSR